MPNPEEGSSGGGANGGRLVIEVQERPDPTPTLLHEALHALLEPRKADIDRAAKAIPGLDEQTLEEGIAYALMPGMNSGYSDDVDLLAESVIAFYVHQRPLSDPYVRFNLLALSIRPALRAALDRQETLTTFLPKAAARWRGIESRTKK